MKNTIIIGFLLFSGVLFAQKVEWLSMNEALKAQKDNPKPIFVDVYTDWCGPCKLMDKNTLQNKDVAKFISKNYYAVKFDAEGTEEVFYNDFTYTNPNYKAERKGRNSQHLFAHALKINGYPSIIFFDKEGEVIAPVVGYQSPTQLEVYLKMISNDDYKRLTTAEAWKDYQAKFKHEFTN